MWDLNQAILETFGALAKRAGKAYCYPSQCTILELVGRFYGVRRSRRTLNRHLSLLERSGYFRRVRRHKRGKDGSLILRSTLYKLRGKFFRWMGWLWGSSASFCSFFRVPFMAHNLSTPEQGSIKNPPGLVGISLPICQKGGPTGSLSPPPPLSGAENLIEIGKLIKSLGS